MPTYGQAVETIRESLPQLNVVPSLAFIIETIDSKATHANSFIKPVSTIVTKSPGSVYNTISYKQFHNHDCSEYT